MRNLSSTRFLHRKYENDSSKLKFWQFDSWIQTWQKWAEESLKRNDHRFSPFLFPTTTPFSKIMHSYCCKPFSYASLSESLGQATSVLTISGTLSIIFCLPCHIGQWMANHTRTFRFFTADDEHLFLISSIFLGNSRHRPKIQFLIHKLLSG